MESKLILENGGGGFEPRSESNIQVQKFCRDSLFLIPRLAMESSAMGRAKGNTRHTPGVADRARPGTNDVFVGNNGMPALAVICSHRTVSLCIYLFSVSPPDFLNKTVAIPG